MHQLDHLLWEEWDLGEGVRRFAHLMGVMPALGGADPDTGTQNALLSLGRGAYLEILAPDPAPRAPPAGFTPRLFSFVVKTSDLAVVEARARGIGLALSEIYTVSRKTPEVQHLAWQTVGVDGHGFGHYVRFFTHFEGDSHPAQTSPRGCELLEVSVYHPCSLELSGIFRVLHIGVSVLNAEQPYLSARLSTPKGIVVLDSFGGVSVA